MCEKHVKSMEDAVSRPNMHLNELGSANMSYICSLACCLQCNIAVQHPAKASLCSSIQQSALPSSNQADKRASRLALDKPPSANQIFRRQHSTHAVT